MQKASCYELVSRAISAASKLLGYTRLREGQELAIRGIPEGQRCFCQSSYWVRKITLLLVALYLRFYSRKV